MYLAIFYNHFGAIKFSRILEANNLYFKLVPAPRQLSSNCNVACEFKYGKDISNIVIDEVEKIYAKESDYVLVYEDDL